ncbi:MAG: CBS domain-containing protein [Candidatus Heimdallarchaeota archaeon]|nr:MAG: CBS domain-containing protein [Candidatus Heimdallarchaeota archaeon]
MSGVILPELIELRRMRKIIGLTQVELAHRVGISQSMIAKIENGTLNPSYDVVRRIYQTLYSIEHRNQTKAYEIMSSVIFVETDDSIRHVFKLMKDNGISQVPVFSKSGRNMGSVTEQTLLDVLLKGQTLKEIEGDPVEKIMDDVFPVINKEIPLSAITSLLQVSAAVLVTEKGKIIGIITKADLLKTSK